MSVHESDELRAVAERLHALRPAAGRPDTDLLLLRAELAAARRAGRRWRVASGALSLAAALLLAHALQPTASEPAVPVEPPQATAPAHKPSPAALPDPEWAGGLDLLPTPPAGWIGSGAGHLALRDRLLAGQEAWPEPARSAQEAQAPFADRPAGRMSRSVPPLWIQWLAGDRS